MSVREKYNTTVREFRRADSLPERLSVWRRAWAWTIEKSRNSTAVFGIFLIPLYFIVIGIWKFEKCGGEGGSLNIPLALIVVGTLIFICALYLPCRRIAKSKAREARMTPRVDPLTEEEIARNFPLKINRVSNFAFLMLCGCLPTLAIWTFRLDPKIPCDPLIYWTSFVTSIIYCVYLTIVLASCFLCCCVFVACPFCIEKWRGGKQDDVETV